MFCELVLSEPDNKLIVRLETIAYAARSIHRFEFCRPDGQPLPAFEPGAHIDLLLGNRLTRQYSLCGSPADPGRYVIAVKREPAGRGGSAWMFDEFRVGQLIEISAPRNNFALHAGPAPAVLIAGGIGITPILGMVRALAQTKRDWRLVYSVRTRAEAAFVTELEQLDAAQTDAAPTDANPTGSRFHLHVDDEQGGRFVDIGRIVTEAPKDAHLYCCGPAPMLDQFEACCRSVEPGRVHIERFTAAASPAQAGGFVVELAKSRRRVNVEPGQSIADALASAGISITVSCEQGICGTCETRVLAGRPDHRDSLLSAQEKAANDVMMICCSGSLSETLVLDL